MTARCGRITSVMPVADLRWFVLSAVVLVGACGGAPVEAEANGSAPVAEAVAPVAAPTAAPAAVQASGEVKLSGAAGTAAIAAAEADAKRRGMTGVAATTAQSFRLTEAGRDVATVITGKATMPDAPYAGCFVAVVSDADVKLIPTIGHGEYEAETCGGPSSVGLLSSRDPVRFGIVFDASSPNAEVQEPVVVNWDRATNAIAIDDARSTAASQAGATTIAAMRRAAR